MNVICITQARLTSSRLPNKVLKSIDKSHNALSLLYERLSKSKTLDKHIYAIPDNSENADLSSWLERNNYDHILGPENDLISRHMLACTSSDDIIVRITSDCPLVDPFWVDIAVSLFKCRRVDYVSTYTPAETSLFCNGSDIEVFSAKTLTMLSKDFNDPSDREHVTFPLWDGRANIRRLTLNSLLEKPISDVRITLDYPEDLQALRRLGEYLDLQSASLLDIVEAYRTLDLADLNGDFRYDQGWI